MIAREFYQVHTIDVAKALLGKLLVRQTEQGIISGVIVETEAYLHDDPASHSFGGQTKRNQSMFGVAGHAYIYLSYGIHEMLNVVTAEEGSGEAVLIRAVMPVSGIELMRRNRKLVDEPAHLLASGPGKLTQAFLINRAEHDGVDLTDPKSSLSIALQDDYKPGEIVTSLRIGISKAADKPWRYYIAGNSSISRK